MALKRGKADWRSVQVAVWPALAAVILAACAGGFGEARRAELDPAQARSLALFAAGGEPRFCVNGSPPQLRAVVTLASGARLETWADGQSQEGKLGFERFEWSAAPGMVDGEGRLRLPADPFALLDRPARVTARVAGKPGVQASIELEPTWRCGGTAGAPGAPGPPGPPGAPGAPGRAGQPGSADNQAQHGELGGRGQEGGAGGPGASGTSTDVALAWVTASSGARLILIRVAGGGAGRAARFLFDPSGGPFTIAASGGDGGPGGDGGGGGAGGEGGDTSAEKGAAGNGSDGGDGGDGGRGGDGGDGGAVRVQHDARHPELIEAIRVDNRGGQGGSGGQGGPGGPGGRGGSSPSGVRGAAGRAGRGGHAGARGRPGRDGPPLDARPADVRRLFADELARAVPIQVD
jgi:hypothetical protein